MYYLGNFEQTKEVACGGASRTSPPTRKVAPQIAFLSLRSNKCLYRQRKTTFVGGDVLDAPKINSY